MFETLFLEFLKQKKGIYHSRSKNIPLEYLFIKLGIFLWNIPSVFQKYKNLCKKS